MPRPLRIDYPGAVHHVFVRGVARSAVARDDADYEHALSMLERAISRFELGCHGWCFLPNHSHLLLTSRLGNLSRAMHWIGTCNAQWFNRRHDRSGHVFQGRFGSRLVEDDAYFMELVRYLALNPVRAGMCDLPGDWRWSSHASAAGLLPVPGFLDTGAFLEPLGSTGAYVDWVAGSPSGFLDKRGMPLPPPKPSLASLLGEDSDRAIAVAHHRHGYSQSRIAAYLGVSCSQICRRLASQR